MDLIDEEQSALTGHAPCTRSFEHLFEISDPRENSRDRFEMECRFIGEEARERRLACAWRPPEDE